MERIGFLIAILLVSTFIIVDGQGNTLRAGETLQHNEILNSSNGIFQLGFFNITSTKKQYLGIWYTADPNKTILWVANGDHPIISGTGTLSLSQDGTLFLRDSTGLEIWSTGSQHSIGEPQACLLDTGLVVVNDTKTGKLLWQSLYHLSDTLLPYVPLGYTKLLDSILETQLTSWNNTGTDPSTGQYVRKLDPSRKYELVTYRGSDVFYRTGPWVGTKWNGFPQMTQELVSFFVSKSDNGAFFWYEPQNQSVLWKQFLASNGSTIRNHFEGSGWKDYWAVPDDSKSYAECGPYGIFVDKTCKCCVDGLFHPKNKVDWTNKFFSSGCERNVPKNDPNHGFVTLRNVKLPDTINAVSDERKSKTECANWCQKNLSCTAYAYIGWQGCLAWIGDLIDMEQFHDGGDNLYVRVGSKSKTNKLKIVLIALGVGIAAIVIFLIAVILVRKRTMFSGNCCSLKWPSRRSQREVVGTIPSTGRENVQNFECYDFKTIIAATGDFSDTKIIGKGQLGPVYKGVLESGEEIAVKRLSRSAHNGDEQLKNELNLLARLKHKNLVKLTGFCIQQEETILCFEFMQNRSLDQVLFGSGQIEDTSQLSWEQRFKLIQGISSGLLYLHEDNGDTTIHRDVKPENILLDKNMVPKISDFGLARLFIEEHSVLITSTIGGTRGYIAPEVQSGMLSTKVDVYSLGMVILEIISGKRNSSSPLGLVSIALQYLNERRILEFKDARLRKSYSHEEIKRCIHIALLCLLEEPQKRPNMRQINLWLASQSIPIAALPGQAAQWGNIAIDSSTVVDSSDLL